eukprot:3285133-Alexandrium_andersonii.AAC.1
MLFAPRPSYTVGGSSSSGDRVARARVAELGSAACQEEAASGADLASLRAGGVPQSQSHRGRGPE